MSEDISPTGFDFKPEEREPNSHLCLYKGRKLSNIITGISCSEGYCVVGSENDDEIYLGDENILKERVMLYIGFERGPNWEHFIDVDLEDILTFASKYCNGIYEKVYKENQNEKSPHPKTNQEPEEAQPGSP